MACKGYLNDFYRTCWDMDLWELIEAIELVSELNQATNSDEVDLYEVLSSHE